MTSKLTAKQIITILTSYNPPQGFEEDVVNPDFIAKLSQRLEQRNDTNGDSAIMLGTFLKPLATQHFVYSAEDIQKLTLPSCLKLDSVARLI
ncbi:Dilute domain-containing protein [Aphelenchoides bicaudatus]|nr:Dilute domain-containing protein [Aphelenchoides bicaudatus]